MSWRTGDANLIGAMAQARLRSSFIYLANAVNDLRGNWIIVAVVLAPLVLASALCPPMTDWLGRSLASERPQNQPVIAALDRARPVA